MTNGVFMLDTTKRTVRDAGFSIGRREAGGRRETGARRGSGALLGTSIVLACAAVVGGCVREPVREPGAVEPARRWRMTAADGEAKPFAPGLLSTANTTAQDVTTTLSPYHRFSHQTIKAADGRLTRMYWVRANSGARIQGLLAKHTRAGDAAVATVEVTAAALADPRTGPGQAPLNTLIPSTGPVSDLLTVTSTEDVLLEVDQFLTAFLTGTPMIEIEANVVEITYDDSLLLGTNLFISEGGNKYAKKADGTPDFSKPTGNADDKSTLFDDFTSPFTPIATIDNNPLASLSVAMIVDDVRYRAVLRALQESGNADVLSAPKMAVLNGHRAVIDTGQKTPVLQPVLGFSGNLQQVQVKFEDTGIFLVVTPYLLMDDMIQIDVNAEVSFVSGFIESGATGIQNPIISNRNASTVVNVRDGQTFAIGGLIATNERELEAKIPVLGDIPLLGYLFKRREITESQSQVIFMVTPRIVRNEAQILYPEK